MVTYHRRSLVQGIPVTRVACVGDGKPSKGSIYSIIFYMFQSSCELRTVEEAEFQKATDMEDLSAVLFVKLLFATVQWQVREAFFLFC